MLFVHPLHICINIPRKKNFLGEQHTVFALEEGECGETDLVEMKVDTGDAKCAPQRMLMAVCEEVA